MRRDLPAKIAAGIRPLYELVRDKYCVDELYDALIVRPLVRLLAHACSRAASTGADRRRRRERHRARCSAPAPTAACKSLQTGYTQSYVFAMLLGGALLIAWLVGGA